MGLSEAIMPEDWRLRLTSQLDIKIWKLWTCLIQLWDTEEAIFQAVLYLGKSKDIAFKYYFDKSQSPIWMLH